MFKQSVVAASLVAALFSTTAMANSLVGEWNTFDEKTKAPKSVIQTYEQGGKLYGKITQVLTPGKENALCEKCPGAQKNTPVKGLVIIEGLTVKGNKADGGTIMDPENGKKYKSKMELKGDTLVVKGCVGPICRGQEWKRK